MKKPKATPIRAWAVVYPDGYYMLFKTCADARAGREELERGYGMRIVELVERPKRRGRGK